MGWGVCVLCSCLCLCGVSQGQDVVVDCIYGDNRNNAKVEAGLIALY